MTGCDPDVRWKQRFSHYRKALAQLTAAVDLGRQRPLLELEQQGLIQAFEFTHELAWNVMKDFFEFQESQLMMGARDAAREAFRRGLVADGEGWMEMIRSRNQTSRAYNREVAQEIAEKVSGEYHPLFLAFEEKMAELVDAA